MARKSKRKCNASSKLKRKQKVSSLESLESVNGEKPTSSIEETKKLTEEDSSVKCAICLDTLTENINIKFLICTHSFHDVCIDNWLNRHCSCPICRVKVPSFKTKEFPIQTAAAASGHSGDSRVSDVDEEMDDTTDFNYSNSDNESDEDDRDDLRDLLELALLHGSSSLGSLAVLLWLAYMEDEEDSEYFGESSDMEGSGDSDHTFDSEQEENLGSEELTM